MKFEEGIKDIADDSRINFIASATTPWHAHGVMASLQYLKMRGVMPVGYVFILPHVQTGYVIDEHFFPSMQSIVVKKIEKAPSSISNNLHKIYQSLWYTFLFAKKSEKRIVYYSEPWTIDAAQSGIIVRVFKNISLIHIVYDEGVSTYFPIQTKSRSLTEWSRNLFTKYVTFKYGYRHIIKKGRVISAKLFNSVGNIVEPNSLVVSFYAKSIKEYASQFVGPYNFQPNTVLFCTTAWNREEIVKDEDIKIIKSVVGIVCSKGYNIVFKQHPRDKYFGDAYGEYPTLPQSHMSLESILLSSSQLPIAVISISSTILVTSKLFLDIKAIDLSKLLNISNIGRYKNEISSFSNAFGNYVISPHSIDELKSCL